MPTEPHTSDPHVTAQTVPPKSRVLARGSDWSLHDLVCDAGPEDRPFEERHDTYTIASVVHGSFNYHADTGQYLLHAGTLLLGNFGRCFTCGHSHSRGDRCVALQISPALFEEVAATAAGASVISVSSFDVTRDAGCGAVQR